MKISILRHHAQLLVLVLLILCMSSTSWAAIYYVNATTGNDSNPGTQTSPWRTVAKVNGAALKPGDTVNFNYGGVWNETLVPKSGSTGNVITYGAYGSGGTKPRLNNFMANAKSYIMVENIEFRSTTKEPVTIYNNSNHITLDSCSVIADTTCTGWAAVLISTNCNYNAIVNSEVKFLNINKQADGINLIYNSNYNLIKNNRIGIATHAAVSLMGSDSTHPTYTCDHNVVQNNIMDNTGGGGTMSLQSNASNNLVEGNVMIGGKSTSFSANLARSFKLVTKNNIIRNNVVKNNPDPNASGLGSDVYAYYSDPPNVAANNRVYNNVITNIANYPLSITTNSDPGASAYKNYYKNNIVYNNGPNYQLWIMKNSAIYDNYFMGNIFYKSGVSTILYVQGVYTTVAGIQSSDATHFRNNIQVDPQLDANFTPLAGSPCIDAGEFLTKVTSPSGNGNVITVEDAYYFSDGFGIIPGDKIRIGNVNTSIVSIDYSTSTVTLADAVSWTNGAPVSLPYNGVKPDIGLLESPKVLPPPVALQIVN